MVVPQDKQVVGESRRPGRYLAAGSAITPVRSHPRSNNAMDATSYDSDGYIIQYVDAQGNDVHDDKNNEEKIRFADFTLENADFNFYPKREREPVRVTETTREILNMQKANNTSILEALKEYFSINMKKYVEMCDAVVEAPVKKYTRKTYPNAATTSQESIKQSVGGYVSKYKNLEESFNEDDLSTSVSISDSDVPNESNHSAIWNQNMTKKSTTLSRSPKLRDSGVLSDSSSDNSRTFKRYTRKTIVKTSNNNDSTASDSQLSDKADKVNGNVTKRYTRKIIANNKILSSEGSQKTASNVEGSSRVDRVATSSNNPKMKFVGKLLSPSNSVQDKSANNEDTAVTVNVSNKEDVPERCVSNSKLSFHRTFLTNDECSDSSQKTLPTDFKKDKTDNTENRDVSQCFSDFYKRKLGRLS